MAADGTIRPMIAARLHNDHLPVRELRFETRRGPLLVSRFLDTKRSRKEIRQHTTSSTVFCTSPRCESFGNPSSVHIVGARRIIMRILTVLLCFVLLAFVSLHVLAQTKALESFNYPLTSLAGKGTASNGFGGPWITDGGGTEGLVSICNTRFDYTNLSYAVAHDTMHLQWVKSNAWSDAIRYKRPLAAAWANTAGKKYWVSYLLDPADSLPIGNTYFMVKLYSGSTEIVALGHGGGGNTPAMWTCGSGWPGNTGADLSSQVITGDPAWLVMRIDMPGNGTDAARTYMWVDPDPASEPDTATAIVKRNSTVPAAGIDNVALEFGGDGILTRLIFDEVRLAQNYADLNAASPTATVARESFTYPVTSVGGLGTAANGFSGPWITDGGGTEGLATICNNRFDYTNLSYTIPHDTMHLQWLKSNAWSDAIRYKRPLAAAFPNTAGNKYWVSYLVDFRDSLPVGNTYFMVKLYSGSTEIVALGHGGGGNTPAMWTCGSGWPGNTGADLSSQVITGDPAWVVMRIDMSGNGTDPCRTYMWVDPDPAAQPDTSTAIVKRNSTVPAAGFDNVALEFGGDGLVVRLIFDEICVSPTYTGLTTTAVPAGKDVPLQFSLAQNYPNPFNPTTNVSYSIERTGEVRLLVYNLLGQQVAVLADGIETAGEHVASFDARGLASGVYYCRLQSGEHTASMKMLLVR
jgi:hypothetical protein